MTQKLGVHGAGSNGDGEVSSACTLDPHVVADPVLGNPYPPAAPGEVANISLSVVRGNFAGGPNDQVILLASGWDTIPASFSPMVEFYYKNPTDPVYSGWRPLGGVHYGGAGASASITRPAPNWVSGDGPVTFHFKAELNYDPGSGGVSVGYRTPDVQVLMYHAP